jgi:hypothetical protein
MVPVLIDVTVGKTTPWASVGNITWVKDEPFDVTVSLRSRSANLVGEEPLPHGNALWPLLLAQARTTPAIWQTFTNVMTLSNTDSPKYSSSQDQADGGAAWDDLYWKYDGEKEWLTGNPAVTAMSKTLTVSSQPDEPIVKVAGYYSEGNDPSAAVEPETKPGVSTATTGILKFGQFSSLKVASETSDYGKISFPSDLTYTYIPFGLESSAVIDILDEPYWKIGGVADIYLAYRLYGRETGSPADDYLSYLLHKDETGYVIPNPIPVPSTGIPAGVSWATASLNLQHLADLASAAYALDPGATDVPLAEQRLKEIWVEAGGYAGVVDISDSKNGVALYGGFLPDANRLTALNSRPSVRASWFSNYGTVVTGNGRETRLYMGVRGLW